VRGSVFFQTRTSVFHVHTHLSRSIQHFFTAWTDVRFSIKSKKSIATATTVSIQSPLSSSHCHRYDTHSLLRKVRVSSLVCSLVIAKIGSVRLLFMENWYGPRDDGFRPIAKYYLHVPHFLFFIFMCIVSSLTVDLQTKPNESSTLYCTTAFRSTTKKGIKS
jgi:hypothetical protein